MYASVAITVPPAGVISTTSTAPAVTAGATTVTDDPFTTVSDVPATPPNVTVDVLVKFVPVMVTLDPPATGPDDRTTREIVGASTNV